MAEPCTPEEIRRAAELLGSNAQRDANVEIIDLSDRSIVQNPSTAFARQHLGFFSNLRTMSGAFGDDIATNAINRVVQDDIKRNNFIGDFRSKWNDALKPVTSKFERDIMGIKPAKQKELFDILDKIGPGGKELDQNMGKMYSPENLKAAKGIRQVIDELHGKTDLSYDKFNNYMNFFKGRDGQPWVQNPNKTEAEKAFWDSLKPEEQKFLKSFEKMANTVDYSENPAATFNAYVHTAGNRMMERSINKIEQEVLIPKLGYSTITDPVTGKKMPMVDNKVVLDMWREYTHHVLGGITEADRRYGDNLSRAFEYFGKQPKSPKHVYQFSHAMSSAFYAGAMGFRPSSFIRQFGQLVPSFAEFGARHTRQSLKMVLDDMAMHPIQGGPLLAGLRERGLMSSHVESLAQSIEAGSAVGKSITAMADTALKGVQITDSFTRAATAVASDLRFDQFLKEGRIGNIPGTPHIKEAVLKAVNLGKVDEAKDLYALENLRNLQFFYGKANRPQWMRGALGNMVGAFMSYPLNSYEMMRYFVKRAAQNFDVKNPMASKDDWMPLFKLTAVTSGMLYAGSEFLDADLISMTVAGSMPHSMAFPKMGLDMWGAGSSTVEWQVGKLFQTGETDYHRNKRHEDYRNSTRAMKGIIPGYGLWTDINKVYDSGQLTRMLALTPKGDKLNQEAKLRREIRRLSQTDD